MNIFVVKGFVNDGLGRQHVESYVIAKGSKEAMALLEEEYPGLEITSLRLQPYMNILIDKQRLA